MARELSGAWPLCPHPAHPAAEGVTLAARIECAAARLTCRYELRGDLSRVRLPHTTAARTDELWRHTCFELFLTGAAGAHYWELNFAPGGAWAAYHFEAYRSGRSEAPMTPCLSEVRLPHEFTLEARLSLSALAAAPGALRLGISAVLESATGALSYWALAHGRAQPDFHDPGTFVLEAHAT